MSFHTYDLGATEFNAFGGSGFGGPTLIAGTEFFPGYEFPITIYLRGLNGWPWNDLGGENPPEPLPDGLIKSIRVEMRYSGFAGSDDPLQLTRAIFADPENAWSANVGVPLSLDEYQHRVIESDPVAVTDGESYLFTREMTLTFPSPVSPIETQIFLHRENNGESYQFSPTLITFEFTSSTFWTAYRNTYEAL